MNTLAEVVAAFRSHQRWVVTSHGRPDGDAVGSVLGAVQILRAMGKRADGFLGDGVPVIYRGLPGATALQIGPVNSANYDAALILECDSLQRTHVEGLAGLYTVNIDHHDTSAEYGDLNYIDPGAAAVAELVHRVAHAADVAITPTIATCLYTAELTDTGSFCFKGTNAATFDFARQMVHAGADPVSIAQQVYFSNPASKMLLLGRALANLQCDGPISWMHVTVSDMVGCGATDQDCEGLVNWALSIRGVEASAFFREIHSSHYRVSLRSKGRIDVARIARTFGGGGHACASGHPVDGSFDLALSRVLTALRHALELSAAAGRKIG